MKKILARAGLVLAVAGAVVAPQAYWLLLSPDRYAMSAVEVETVVDQHFTRTTEQHLDRVECEPISVAPGTSQCEAQDDEQVLALVLELGEDGEPELFVSPAGELPTWSAG